MAYARKRRSSKSRTSRPVGGRRYSRRTVRRSTRRVSARSSTRRRSVRKPSGRGQRITLVIRHETNPMSVDGPLAGAASKPIAIKKAMF